MITETETGVTLEAIRALNEKQRELDRRVSYLKEEIVRLEAELLEAKGPCSNKRCRLYYAHFGPCEPYKE